MFERYTEKARRVIFFARYEASQFGSPTIEPEHLLLGLMREDKHLINRFLKPDGSIEAVRAQIEKQLPVKDRVSTSLNLPLSQACNDVLALAAEEAEHLGHKHVSTEHLLLGILREENSLATSVLRERGLQPAMVRDEAAQGPVEKAERAVAEMRAVAQPLQALSEFSVDLTQAAARGEFDPLIGRDAELERVMHILALRARNNAVLMGEPGVGKATLVKALAQRIFEGNVPSHFADKRVLALDISMVLAGATPAGKLDERLKTVVEDVTDAGNVLLFIPELFTPGSADCLSLLRPVLMRREIQCLVAATPEDYARALGKEPWLEQCFQPVRVPPPNAENAIKIMLGIKERYEKFHGVIYSEVALRSAVFYAERFLPARQLPDKAIDLIDEAGASVKLRATTLPLEVAECSKRVKLLSHQMETAIAQHAFEKARRYSEEERREREELRRLRKKHGIAQAESATVTQQDIEEAVARVADVPLANVRLDPYPGKG